MNLSDALMSYLNNIEQNKIDLFRIIKELNNKGYISGSSSNISIKIDENRYIITPSGKSVIGLREEDFLLIDHNGIIIRRNNNNLKVSSEILMHLFLL